ncbi:MAG: HPr(Ser) kinase/phosphatase [Proteobacteria bacterium]|nr:HPr(Ser) kinase/phosphatase [Pseudomonadota bacterium]NOG60733.1 HPr(Ser) kinase/phosphatase [Pseudomonadota bacterium]
MTGLTNQLSIEDLYNIHHDKLKLKWTAGQQGGKQASVCDEEQATPESPNNHSLVGHLNLIHPHQIQVIGKTEMKYLEGLRDTSMQDAVTQLFQSNPVCIIITDGCEVPALLKRKCNAYNVPLFSTPENGSKLANILHYFLTNLFADILTLHGVFMEVMAIGVLITGPSGIGKSELALELISRGHRLIADDAPLFSKITPDIINGTCPKTLQDFLEVRGLGIINVRELFGDSAIKKNKYLKLIVQLEPMDTNDLLTLDRLEGSYNTRTVLDLDVPQITLPVAPGRNLAIMLECAARNNILRSSGYNASEVFARRQKRLMESGEE